MPEKIKIQDLSNKEWGKNLSLFHYSLFISPKWIEAVADTNHKPVYLDITINEKTVGKISGLVIKGGKTRSFLYFYAGPALIKIDQDIHNKCLNTIFKYARKNSYYKVIIDSYDNKHSLKYTKNKNLQNKRVEYAIPLHKGIKNIEMSKRFRRNVKKGKKINPKISESQDTRNISTLIELLSSTKKIRIRKYNKHYNPFYLKNLNETTLKKLLTSGIAHLRYSVSDNSIDCMEFNLEKDDRAYMLLKGANENGYKNGLSSFLSYYLIKQYTNNGFSYYNQGGRPSGEDGEGLALYKKSMGAEEITVYGVTTNFLTFPLILLNPFLTVVRKLPNNNNPVVKFLKRFIYTA